MKQLFMAGAVCAAIAAPASALAQATAAAAPASPHTVTGNMAIVSDYRFRGISQTGNDPAIQGGIDYSHESGFYLGNWNSSITSDSFTNAAGIEMDFYGGFKFPVGDITVDIGALYYYYPDAKTGVGREEYNTLEAYLGLSYGPVTFKVWYALTDWFGVNEDSGYEDDTDGSIYYELNASFPIAEGWTLIGHAGYQDVHGIDDYDGEGDLNYFDWKIGVAYDWNGWALGAAIVGTDNPNDSFYVVDGDDDIDETTVVFSISKTF